MVIFLMSCEWPPCLSTADVKPGDEDFLRSSYSKYLDILCLPHLSCTTFAKLGERFAQSRQGSSLQLGSPQGFWLSLDVYG